MVQWVWTCSEMWAEDAEDAADVASSTVTCSLDQNVGQRLDGEPEKIGRAG